MSTILDLVRKKLGDSDLILIANNLDNLATGGSRSPLQVLIEAIDELFGIRWFQLGFAGCVRRFVSPYKNDPTLPIELGAAIGHIRSMSRDESIDELLIGKCLRDSYINARGYCSILHESKRNGESITIDFSNPDTQDDIGDYLVNHVLGAKDLERDKQTMYAIHGKKGGDNDKEGHPCYSSYPVSRAIGDSCRTIIKLISEDPLTEREKGIVILKALMRRPQSDARRWFCDKLQDIVGPSGFEECLRSMKDKPYDLHYPLPFDYRKRRLRTHQSIVQKLLDHTRLPKDLANLVSEYLWNPHLEGCKEGRAERNRKPFKCLEKYCL